MAEREREKERAGRTEREKGTEKWRARNTKKGAVKMQRRDIEERVIGGIKYQITVDGVVGDLPFSDVVGVDFL